MKTKLGSVFNSLLGKEQPQNNPVSYYIFIILFPLFKILIILYLDLQLDKLETLKERVAKIHDLFHNPDTTEFIIVTIPTVMLTRNKILGNYHIVVQCSFYGNRH
jgi:hypothetical protein